MDSRRHRRECYILGTCHDPIVCWLAAWSYPGRELDRKAGHAQDRLCWFNVSCCRKYRFHADDGTYVNRSLYDLYVPVRDVIRAILNELYGCSQFIGIMGPARRKLSEAITLFVHLDRRLESGYLDFSCIQAKTEVIDAVKLEHSLHRIFIILVGLSVIVMLAMLVLPRTNTQATASDTADASS